MDFLNRIAAERKTEAAAVRPVDLYDFYGIASLSRKALPPELLERITGRLENIRDVYLGALKNRFGGFFRCDEDLNLQEFVNNLKQSLNEEIIKQATEMRQASSKGFNVMAMVDVMHQQQKQSKLSEKYVKALSESLAGFQAADYPKIAQGVVDLHEAESCKDIILAVDFMNDLQHCGGYVLVDFVAGQRDPTNALGNKVYQEILDFKRDAMSPLDFAEHMSPAILEVVQQQYGEEDGI
ncbi:MAG: hypothetical protein ACW99J_20565 [Candidatus Thorarchaeota archaeon]|jgi:hypothetical protein